MNCDNCDGYGWLDLVDFVERFDGEILGDEPDLYWIDRGSLDTALCPACDGFGVEESEEYDDILATVDRYMNYRGIAQAFRVDFDNRKLQRVIYFKWRDYRKDLLVLPTRRTIFRDDE